MIVMSTIKASSIGAPLDQHLARHINARVLARFDSTIQLESEDGTLWAITAHPNAGAMRLVAPTVPFWRQGTVVRARKRRIFADGFELTWQSCALFDPQPQRRALTTAERLGSARSIADALTRQSLPDAFGFWDELSERWAPISVALRKRDGDTLNATISDLIGRGTGLTPTGDDFLQALAVTLQSGDDDDRTAFAALSRTVAPNLVRTTPASGAFLQEALHGWAFGALKGVLDALPEVTQETMNALLDIGATSGPAYAFGVLMGLTWNN